MGLHTADDPDLLLASHRAALAEAADLLIDEFFEDVAALRDGEEFATLHMADYLPPRYLPRYTPLFAKQFLTCLLVVVWKLRAPDPYLLACVAEELALAALLQRAEQVVLERGEEPNFALFEDAAFEDRDFELLFDPAHDGIDETSVGDLLGMSRLDLANWFAPFRDTEPVHPYVADVHDAGW